MYTKFKLGYITNSIFFHQINYNTHKVWSAAAAAGADSPW